MTQNNGQANGQPMALAVVSAQFVADVERQFTAELGDVRRFTDYEKTLAQHLFLKVDAQLATLEAKRLDKGGNGAPIIWANVNFPKLAIDAVHRVNLGLDALIPNHISPIPYWNKRIGKYDIDLRIGYVGKDYCRRKLAVEEPVDVIYELVYSTDTFKPYLRSRTNEIESYDFEINKPFERGEVVGGFGYIKYEDPAKNRLVIVTKRDFEKAEAASGSQEFWGDKKWRIEMMFKTLVHRVADKIPLDPGKVNSRSYAYVEAQEAEGDYEQTVDAEANGRMINVTPAANQSRPAPPVEQIQSPQQTMQQQAPPPPQPSASVAPQQEMLEGPGF